jgi:hypothetical protein
MKTIINELERCYKSIFANRNFNNLFFKFKRNILTNETETINYWGLTQKIKNPHIPLSLCTLWQV